MKWRITFLEEELDETRNDIGYSEGRFVKSNFKWIDCPKIELRSDSGAVLRIAKGGEFQIIDSPLGEVPMTYGEVYVSRENPHKYRTTCYVRRAALYHSIDYFVKPIDDKKDQYYAILGDLTIFEFDKFGNPYDIVTCTEGNSVVVGYTEDSNKNKRYYHEEISKLSDSEYDYILSNFVDPRNWLE